MRAELAVTIAAALVLALILTGAVRRFAIRHGWLDHPNQRSSHSAPTPRGGGIAIVIASLIALSAQRLLGMVEPRLFAALLVGGLAVSTIGFMDDRRRVSARLRLLVHAGVAVLAMALLGGLPPIQIGAQVLCFGAGGFIFGALAIIWALNLFNFMDGIDGLAAGEAAFVCAAGAVLATCFDAGAGWAAAALAVCAASIGFLIWNWPPARIFMGDVGSGYLGYAIALFALAHGRELPAAIFPWLILGGVFLCDATATLAVRALRRERVFDAHRSHAYQRLARRWHSHRRVTVVVAVINVCWLLPSAIFALMHPSLALWTAVVALVPLVTLVLFTGAGRAET
ncbi:MAG TPA: glycosyltransferase family 4 protein [Steroidobacteraceae bacterium]|jgi:Fuc2NAc and GlcNAc transferase